MYANVMILLKHQHQMSGVCPQISIVAEVLASAHLLYCKMAYVVVAVKDAEFLS